MDAGGRSDVSFIFNTNALFRDLQECLMETMDMMEHHVGASNERKESSNKQHASSNNSSLIVREVSRSNAVENTITECDEYVILDTSEWNWYNYVNASVKKKLLSIIIIIIISYE